MNRRIIFLDIVRTVAIILVVLCHSVEGIYEMNLNGWGYLGTLSKLFRIIFFTLGRLGVPLFLFITGYLILNKKIEEDKDVILFYKRNLIPLLITTEIWIILYNIFLSFYNNNNINYSTLIKNMLFIEKVNISNIWYMPMIIGVYIALPFVNKIVKSFSVDALKIPIVIIFILYFIVPTINIIQKINRLESYSNILYLSFLGGTYGLYILFGYFISTDILKKIYKSNILKIIIIAFIASCVIQIYAYQNNITYNIWYDSPFIFICSLFLFEFFKRIRIERISKKILDFCIFISNISLGIFFVHIILEKCFQKLIKTIEFSNPLRVFILFILSFICSILIIYIFSKIKFIKNKIFLVKN